AGLGARARHPLLVGFAAETENVEQNAREKLRRKNLDLIVANDVADAFGKERNRVVVLGKDGARREVEGTKLAVAHAIWDVGEAPGEDEDLQGFPFVGKAGQLLTKMIEAMGLRREDVYICNTVKCRPPNNRNPEPDELAACEPFLKGQLGAVKPEAIVTLGKFAAQSLLRDSTPITRLRGRWREYQGIPVMPTFHPAYLLRSPAEKGKVWEDLKQVMKKLQLPLPKGAPS